MNGYLRQSTASQSRAIGPFVDDTDFKTAKTALTIANTDIKLRANGTTLSNKNSGGGTHQVNGWYSVTWDATDTANVGELFYSVVVSGALQVFGSYVVLEEAVYDAFFASSAPGYVDGATVNATKFGGTTVTGRDLGASVLLSSGTGTGQISLSSGTVTTGAISNNAITASAIASDAITSAKIATDAIGSDEIATSAVTEIVAGLLNTVNTGATFNVNNSVGKQIRQASGGTVVTIRSGTLQSGSTSNTAKLDSGASSTNNIYVGDLIVLTGGTGAGQTRSIIAYNGTTKVATVDSNWVTTPDNTTTFDVVAGANAAILNEGVLQSATGTTAVLATTASSNNDVYTTGFIAIVSGTGSGQTREITAYVGSTKTATVSAWSVTPDSTSGYVIVPNGSLSTPGGATAAQIAAAVYAQGVSQVTGAVGSVTGNVGGNVTGSVGSVASGGITSSSFAAGAIDNAAIATDAIGAAELATSAVNEIAAAVTGGGTAPTADEIAQTIFKYDLSTITGEASRSFLNAIRLLRNRWRIIGTILRVYKEDDATEAWNAELTPTSGANPITQVDPQ